MVAPPEIIELFWRVCRGEISPCDFEAWVEQNVERLGGWLRNEDVRVLLDADYSEVEQVERVRALIWQLIIKADPSFPFIAFGSMTAPRKVVRTHVATCTACGARSPMPGLGDFSYGRFIFTSESGRYHAYFEAVANPIWELIQSIAQKTACASLTPDEAGDLLADAVARCADPFAGESFSAHQICPVCLRDRSLYLTDHALSNAVIPIASFIGFNRMSPEERRRMVMSIVAQFRM